MDLENKSVEELRVLLEKQEKILSSPVAKSLPDKGAKIQVKINQIKEILKAKNNNQSQQTNIVQVEEKLSRFVIGNESSKDVEKGATQFIEDDEELEAWKKKQATLKNVQDNKSTASDLEYEHLQRKMKVLVLDEAKSKEVDHKIEKLIKGTRGMIDAKTTRQTQPISVSESMKLMNKDQADFLLYKDDKREGEMDYDNEAVMDNEEGDEGLDGDEEEEDE